MNKQGVCIDFHNFPNVQYCPKCNSDMLNRHLEHGDINGCLICAKCFYVIRIEE